MAIKQVTEQVKRQVTVCDVCGKKCRGSWLYVYANNNKPGRKDTSGLKRWWAEILSLGQVVGRSRGYDVCDRCLTAMVEKRLASAEEL